MLIVGDYPYKQDIDSESDIQSIDIIVAEEKRKDLLRLIGIKEEGSVDLAENIKMYSQHGNRYVIITATNNAYLTLLMRANFAINTLRVATPAINYAFLWYMTRLRFYDAPTWLKITMQVKSLKPYFYKSYIHTKSQFKLLAFGERLALQYFSKASYITKPYEKIGFVKYDKYELLIAMGCVYQSPFRKMTLQARDDFFNQATFERYSEFEKKVALLEMIYLHVISEYFIPEMEVNGKYPDVSTWKLLFVTSAMDIITSTPSGIEYIKNYMLENLDDMIGSFRPQLISTFLESEKNKSIKPLTSWDNGKN